MIKKKKKCIAVKSEPALPRRRGILSVLGFVTLLPLTACGQGDKKMQNYTVLDVEMFSNIDRPISDIMFNGTDLGVMNKYGGTGLITGVRIPYGVQTLTWTLGGPEGTPRNGEHMKIKNTLIITPELIPPGTRYVGLHLYPDDTAEVTFSESMPERTERGKKIKATRK